MNSKLNWAVIALSIATTLMMLITDDSVLITNLNLSPLALSILKLVAFVVSPLIAATAATNIYLRRNQK